MKCKKRSIKFNFLNKNNRIYTEYNSDLDNFKLKIKKGVYGTFDYDANDFQVDLSKISHKIEELEIINNTLYVTISTLNTDKGKILDMLIKDNAYFTLSSQAIGNVNDDYTVNVDELITFNVSVGIEEDAFITVKDIRKLKLEKIKEKYEI